MKGALPHDQIPSVLKTWDVAVAPYPVIPNFYFSPLKIFEYMAAGLPVVASSIGQIKNLVQNESNGLLCSPGNINDLTAALHFLKGILSTQSKSCFTCKRKTCWNRNKIYGS